MTPQQNISRRSFDTFSLWALLATLALALVSIAPFSAVPLATIKTFILAGGAIVTLALYILARLTRGNIFLPSSILLGALWLPVLAYLLSALFSGVSFGSALWGTMLDPDTVGFMLVLSVLGTLTALIMRRAKEYSTFLRLAGWAFVFVSIVEVLIIAVAQFAPTTVSPGLSLLGSFNDLAVFMGLGIVTTLIALRFFEYAARTRQILSGAIVLGLFLLAIANSMLVWILVALTALGLFVEGVMRRGVKNALDVETAGVTMVEEDPLEGSEGHRSIGLSLSVLAVSLFFLIGGTLGDALANSLHINLLNVRPSWQSTFTVGQQVFSTSPIFGSGPNTFGNEWLKYRNASLNSTIFWNVDFASGIGFIPSSFITTGAVGVFAWLSFLGLLLFCGLRLLLVRTPKDPFMRSVSVVSFIGTLYLFAIACFDLPSAVTLALAFVFAGVFISTMSFGVGGERLGILFSRSPRRGFVIVFLLTIVLLLSVVVAYSLVERFAATVALANAEKALASGKLNEADQSVQNSIAFVPTALAYQVQATIANDRLNLIAASSTTDQAAAQQQYQQALSSGINASLQATRLAPNNYQNWITLGNLYAEAVPLGVTSSYESAKTAYEKAVALNPTNPQIPYVMAQLEILHKDTKAAEEDLQKAITLKQDYTEAIFLLSQLEVQDGNIKAALNSALAAAYFTPNNPSILFQVGVLYAAQNDLSNAVLALTAAVKANPQFANARYFLAAVYAKQGDLEKALAQMQAIAALSGSNATAVEAQIVALTAGKDPFPKNLLSTSSTPGASN